MKGDYCIGVVIPARNEELFIRGVVESLPDYVDAIVVINDGSVDGTKSILEQISMPKLHVVELDGKGVGAAIDTGHQFLWNIGVLRNSSASLLLAMDK